MSRDLEQDLRQALRAVNPSPEFTNRLLAGITTQRRAATSIRRLWPRQTVAAASVLVALGLGWGAYHHQQRERALQAHVELIKALAITSRSLDRAYQAVHSLDTDKVHGG
jgi:hypothetical protein